MIIKFVKNNIKILKLFPLLLAAILLNACGGGGGGGGAAGGGASPVSACTDTGTAFQTNEYKRMGNGTTGSLSPLRFVCASNAYAKGYTGDGIKYLFQEEGEYTSVEICPVRGNVTTMLNLLPYVGRFQKLFQWADRFFSDRQVSGYYFYCEK